VDVGVHQDGLVHVSELAHRFVKDPAEVVKVQDRVKVRVLSVDLPRKRIALSIKQASAPATTTAPAAPAPQRPAARPAGGGGSPERRPPAGPFNGVRFTKR
jgi:uncharacterized protein